VFAPLAWQIYKAASKASERVSGKETTAPVATWPISAKNAASNPMIRAAVKKRLTRVQTIGTGCCVTFVGFTISSGKF
jgi:hypothetical protein